MLINKTVVFWGSENSQVIGERPLHPEKSLFGALFGPKVSLDLIISKTAMERLTPSIRSVVVI